MLFIMLSIGILEFGRALWLRNHISHAADVGARTLLLNADATNTDLEDATRAAFVGDPSALQITVTTQTASGVTYRLIQLQYPLTLFLPGLSTPTITFGLQRRIPVL